MTRLLERHFGLEAAGTTLRTELLAGLTTFLTMAYIAFVNPSILEAAGMPKGAVITATCLSAGLASLLMGLYGRLPVGLAPGMGTNAYFAYYVCGELGHAWQTALGAVFLSGAGFLVLTVTGLRERIIAAIPASMKHAIAAGIGVFIAFVGLRNAHLVVDSPAVLVALGDVTRPGVLVTALGVVVSAALLARRIRGALLLGIFAATALAIALGVSAAPDALFALPPSLAPIFLAMDVQAALGIGVLHLVFAFFFVDLFDTLATLIAVAEQGGLMTTDAAGRRVLPRATRALASDAVGTMAGAALGTSTVTSYVESTAGIAEGGRTGLVAVVVGLLFCVLPFVSPLLGAVPPEATAPALILIAALMLQNLRQVPFDDPTEAVPATLACLGIPLTFSISNGLALGFIAYPVVKLLAGRAREVSPLMFGLGLLFAWKLALIPGG